MLQRIRASATTKAFFAQLASNSPASSAAAAATSSPSPSHGKFFSPTSFPTTTTTPSAFPSISSPSVESAPHVTGVITIPRTRAADPTAGLKGKLAESAEASRGMHVTAGFSSIAMWKKKPIYVDPEFEVVNAGVGSVLVVKLPPTSRFVADVGTAIGTASTVDRRLTSHGGFSNALAKRIGGGSLFFQQFWTRTSSGDAILAPKRQGDIAVLTLTNGSEYYIRRTAFLAATEKINLSASVKVLGLGAGSLFAYRASGAGKLAITGYGGLYRLVLAPGEEYLVPPEHLAAWDAVLDPFPEMEEPAAAPKAPVPAATDKPVKADASAGEKVAAALVSAGRAAGKWGWWAVRMLAWRISKAFVGDKGFYRLRGPGEFYISSRLEPSLSWLRDVRLGRRT
ncbi:hypothetical protein HDU96_009250 [Phlyctochytrium bullatum]|nr:hypothetical protein HDU96_009250 [Phlyctochytrium bullatum]